MGAQQRIKRLIGQRSFNLNDQITFELPRNYDIESYQVEISGVGTLVNEFPGLYNGIADGAVTGGHVVRADAPFGLVKRCELVLEGRQTLVNLPGHVLGMANFLRTRQPFSFGQPSTWDTVQKPPFVAAYMNTTRSGVAVLTPNTLTPTVAGYPALASNGVDHEGKARGAFKGTFFIDAQSLSCIRPKDTNMRTGGLQTLELRLTMDNFLSLVYPVGTAGFIVGSSFNVNPETGNFLSPWVLTAPNPAMNDAANTVTGGLIKVYSIEIQEFADDKGQISVPSFVQRLSYQEININAPNDNLRVRLPTDNFIRGVILSAKVAGQSVDDCLATSPVTVPATNTGNIIASARLERGVDVRFFKDWSSLTAENAEDYTHPRFQGYGFCDLMSSGSNNDKISDAWNVQGGADTNLVLNCPVAGPAVTVGITTIEYIPLARAAG